MTTLLLTARDLHDDDRDITDGCVAAVTVTGVDTGHVGFEIGIAPDIAKLLNHVKDTPLTEDDPNGEHLLYDRYEMFENPTDMPESAMPLLVIQLTDLENGAMSMEYSFMDDLEPDAIQGAHTIMDMLTRGSKDSQ
ncbi:hypothetical protein [Bifidobacterium sp. SO1]|uniref:hypothetical protein n=1 Tax=Bifidobacterium sp. SO1 TaxID=2809029 RepID=UPI001BDC03A9|nr:hypothetical protein [Bifidobacterium sp. SO1]MBT1162897.1 hypothetical protein [Bifidobacterium sp. SO1]